MKSITAAIAIATITALAAPARADINLDNIVPPLTKCWGSTCIEPDASVNAVLFDISAKKWQLGSTSLGAGIALLFASDSYYSSGLALDLTGVLTQESGADSFVMPTIGVIVARYFKVGYSYRLSSSAPNASYISVAGNLPWDLFTKATIPVRAAAAVKAERAAEAR